jgi:adsorption protein B
VSLFFFSDVWPNLLGILVVTLLLSGIDDLVPSFICLWFRYVRRLHLRYLPPPDLVRERKIAIFVPCWNEAAVIGSMVRHNISAVRYRNYDFFLGVYPNDKATGAAARQLAETFRNVHVAVCAKPGPTSKADCLNSIYRRMAAYEAEHSAYYDTVLLHDAEDLIHPEALAVISRERTRNAMVQIPVLPLKTPATELTHGCYCDDFAEYQSVDMRARQFSGSFIPSCGVGTGLARHVLQRLSEERKGRIFDPASLTEDYETGVYVFRSGYRPRFVPLQPDSQGFRATREYFPRTVRAAIRQRTRWVTGIALQSWKRDGWRGSFNTKYWFWRDRKGLIANPLGLFTNLLFLLGAADWMAAHLAHRPWHFAIANPALIRLCCLSSALQCVRLGMRVYFTGRVYGPAMACGVPVRFFHGSFINCCASLRALWQFSRSYFRKEPLRWLKTDHSYPNRASLSPQARSLAEVLVSEGYIEEDLLEQVKTEIRSDEFLAALLLERGIINEENISQAVSLKGAVPLVSVTLAECRKRIARLLPREVGKRFHIIPYSVKDGKLFVVGPTVPEGNWQAELSSWTRLPIEFQLVTRSNFEELESLVESRAATA